MRTRKRERSRPHKNGAYTHHEKGLSDALDAMGITSFTVTTTTTEGPQPSDEFAPYREAYKSTLLASVVQNGNLQGNPVETASKAVASAFYYTYSFLASIPDLTQAANDRIRAESLRMIVATSVAWDFFRPFQKDFDAIHGGAVVFEFEGSSGTSAHSAAATWCDDISFRWYRACTIALGTEDETCVEHTLRVIRRGSRRAALERIAHEVKLPEDFERRYAKLKVQMDGELSRLAPSAAAPRGATRTRKPNRSAKEKDGPTAGNRFVWKGKSQMCSPQTFRILKCMWHRRSVNYAEFVDGVFARSDASQAHTWTMLNVLSVLRGQPDAIQCAMACGVSVTIPVRESTPAKSRRLKAIGFSRPEALSCGGFVPNYRSTPCSSASCARGRARSQRAAPTRPTASKEKETTKNGKSKIAREDGFSNAQPAGSAAEYL
jgi:hypothetical protein